MRLLATIIAFAVVLVVATMIGSQREPFEETETNLDRLCGVVGIINVDDPEIKDMCRRHLNKGGRDYCVKGCDPTSLCKFPVLDQCLSGSRDCNITHAYVGPHLSSFNDNLPRFYAVKHGFCLRFEVGTRPWRARADPGVLDVMMAFPKAVALPHVDQGYLDLSNYWKIDSSEVSFDFPFASSPDVPVELSMKTVENPLPIKYPAFAIYETSTDVDGNNTWREVSEEGIHEMIERDGKERRPASPDRMSFTFFKRFAGPGDNLGSARPHDLVVSFHTYKVDGGDLKSFLMGDVEVGDSPVTLLVCVIVNMKEGGKVEEVREIAYSSGTYRICRKVPSNDTFFYSELGEKPTGADRYFLGSLDPESCKDLLQGEGPGS